MTTTHDAAEEIMRESGLTMEPPAPWPVREHDAGVQEEALPKEAKGAKSAKGAAHGQALPSALPSASTDKNKDGGALRQVYGVRFSTLRTLRKTWLWEENGYPIIPLGEAGYVAGPGGIGKTTYFLQHVVARLTRGTLPGVFEGEPRNCAVFCAEDSYEHIVKPRLIAAGADLERVFKIATRTAERDDLVPQFPYDAESLEEFLAVNEIVFILLDPVMSCLGPNIKHNDPQAIRTVFDAFQPVVERTSSSLISVMHLNRRHGEDATARMSGAHSYSDCARVGFVFAEVEENSYVVSQKKNSYAPQKAPDTAYHFESVFVDTDDGIPVSVGLVVVDGESEVSADDALTAVRQTAEEREEVADLAGVLYEYFLDHGVGEFREIPSSDIPRAAKSIGASVDQLKRAKRRAGIKSGKTQGAFDGGWVWHLMEPVPVGTDNNFADPAAKGAPKGADPRVLLPSHSSLPSLPSGELLPAPPARGYSRRQRAEQTTPEPSGAEPPARRRGPAPGREGRTPSTTPEQNTEIVRQPEASPAGPAAEKKKGRPRNPARDQKIRKLFDEAVEEFGPNLTDNGGPGMAAFLGRTAAGFKCHDNTVRNALKRTSAAAS
ncbi:AAA family ATPase [Streptomyces sp. NPDC096033]|uniref:AAA family ATPase n=1 Tax=Streptomyces sp. NPDC096033 TaxID=3366071 RepID=UPI0037F4D114